MPTTSLDHLRRIPMFADLPPEGLTALHEQTTTRLLPADTWLFQQHDRGDACYTVLSGSIRLVLEAGSAEETTLGLLGPGSFFGELSLLEPDGTRAAGAVAVIPTEVLEIPTAAFEAMLRSQPDLAVHVLRRVASHLRRSDERRLDELRHKNVLLTEAYRALEQAQSEALRRARAARELELARELQRRLIPTTFPALPKIAIAAATFPAYEMSGDFYQLRMLDEKTVEIVMADVCDKGTGAALLMALAKGLLMTEDRLSPLEVVQRFNRLLRTTNIDAAVVTLLYAQLDLEHHVLRYVRAGHDWPIYYSTVDNYVSLLEGGGMPAGVSDEPFLEEMSAILSPGDALILYTDGLCDARNSAGASYGRDRLVSAVKAYSDLSAAGLADAILGDVRAFQGVTPPIDDLTLLVLKLAA
ncbi:MAG TPA: SpoIIE family protein phosphatase [Herpetosiphonaceae bacterium]